VRKFTKDTSARQGRQGVLPACCPPLLTSKQLTKIHLKYGMFCNSNPSTSLAGQLLLMPANARGNESRTSNLQHLT
jgi:hypothetical protein